ncbi:MAG: hypothetical protein EA370_00110 [Wenzhouxiangella sp.]|nr:MAG: hypothetical protein EA370_00110 [Wenzhouxiangella sp.]
MGWLGVFGCIDTIIHVGVFQGKGKWWMVRGERGEGRGEMGRRAINRVLIVLGLSLPLLFEIRVSEMRIFFLLLVTVLFLLPVVAWADGQALDRDMQALEQARDLAAMRARMAQAEQVELDSPEAWNWRAWLATADGDWEQAEEIIGQGLERFPESAALELQRTALMVRGFNDVGNLGAMRLARRVRQGFERAVELDPEHVGARTGLILYFLNAPRIAGGGEARAEPHLEELKKRSLASYYEMRATLAASRSESEDALTFLTKALALEETSGRRLNHGLLLQQFNDYGQARAVFTSLVETYPTHGAAWYQIGRTSVLAEDWLEEGRQAFERFLELPAWPGDPSPAAAWWRLGQLHALADDKASARSAFEQALALDGEFEEAARSLDQLTLAD